MTRRPGQIGRRVLASAVLAALILPMFGLWRAAPEAWHAASCRSALEAGRPDDALAAYDQVVGWRGSERPELLAEIVTPLVLAAIRNAPSDPAGGGEAMAAASEVATPELIEALVEVAASTPNRFGVDIQAHRRLAARGDPGSRAWLLALLETETDDFRLGAAAAAIHEIGDAAALPWAREAFEGGSPAIAGWGATLLGELGGVDELDLLLARASAEGAAGCDAMTLAGLIAIARHDWARPRAVEQLRAHREHRSCAGRVLPAMVAHGGVGVDDALAGWSKLEETPMPEWLVRLSIGRALAEAGDPVGFELLAGQLDSPDPQVRLCAAFVIVDVDASRGDLVLDFARAELPGSIAQPGGAFNWIQLLARAGDEQDLAALRPLLGDDVAHVRSSAASAVLRIVARAR